MKTNCLLINIEKSAAEIFAYTTNPEKTPLWMKVMKEETAEPFPAQIGSVYKNTEDGKNWVTYNVVELIPGKIIEFMSDDANYHIRYACEDKENGTSSFEYTEWVDRGWLEDPFDMDMMETLKKAIEE